MTNKETGHGPAETTITDFAGNVICTYAMVEQAAVGGTVSGVTKAGPPEDIKAEPNLKPVTTVATGSAISCGAAAGKEVSATIVGATTLKAFKDLSEPEGEQIGLMVG